MKEACGNYMLDVWVTPPPIGELFLLRGRTSGSRSRRRPIQPIAGRRTGPEQRGCERSQPGRDREDSDVTGGEYQDPPPLPTGSMDNKPLGERAADDDKVTAIAAQCGLAGMIASHICERKRASDKWMVDRCVMTSRCLGTQDLYSEVNVARPYLSCKVQLETRRNNTISQNSLASDHQSNMAAESGAGGYGLDLCHEARAGAEHVKWMFRSTGRQSVLYSAVKDSKDSKV